MTEPPDTPTGPTGPSLKQVKASQIGASAKAKSAAPPAKAKPKKARPKQIRDRTQPPEVLQARARARGDQILAEATRPPVAVAAPPGPAANDAAAGSEAGEDDDDLGADEDDEQDAADLEGYLGGGAGDGSESEEGTGDGSAAPTLLDDIPSNLRSTPVLDAQRKTVARVGTLDPELTRRHLIIEAKRQALRAGQKIDKFRGQLSYADDFDLYASEEVSTGRLLVRVIRNSPNYDEFLAVNVRHFPNWDAFNSWLRNYHYDGRATQFSYEMTNSGTYRCKGKVTFGEDLGRIEEWKAWKAMGRLPRWKHYEGGNPELEGTLNPSPPGAAAAPPAATQNGAPVTQVSTAGFCPHCAVPRVVGAQFCAGCGRALGAPPAAQAAAPMPQVQAPPGMDPQMFSLVTSLINKNDEAHRQEREEQRAQLAAITNGLNAMASRMGTPQVQTQAPAPAAPAPPQPAVLDGGIPAGSTPCFFLAGKWYPGDWRVIQLPEGAVRGFFLAGQYCHFGSPTGPAVAPPAAPAAAATPASELTSPDGIPVEAVLGFWLAGNPNFYPGDWRQVSVPPGATKGYKLRGRDHMVGGPQDIAQPAPANGTTPAGAAPEAGATLSQAIQTVARGRNEIMGAASALGIQLAPGTSVPEAAAGTTTTEADRQHVARLGKYAAMPLDENGNIQWDASAGAIAATNADTIVGGLKDMAESIMKFLSGRVAGQVAVAQATTEYAAALKTINEQERIRIEQAERARQAGLQPAQLPRPNVEQSGIGVREKGKPAAPANGNGQANGANGNGPGPPASAGGPPAGTPVPSEDDESEFSENALSLLD